jgi:hypothetical protein
MDTTLLSDRIHAALNKELMKRLLVKYFTQKGFSENFDKRINPQLLQDMVLQIPQFAGRVEVTPYVEEINPNNGVVTLGWNLFILGTSRMYLGESTVTSLSEVRSPIAGINNNMGRFKNYATPSRIIHFITEILSKDKYGDITSRVISTKNGALPPLSVGDSTGFFQTKHRQVY